MSAKDTDRSPFPIVAGLVVLAVVAWAVFGLSSGSSWYEPWQTRLAEARAATEGERLLEGRIVATNGTVGETRAVALVTWQRTRRGDHHVHDGHLFHEVPFDLVTDEGTFRVDARGVGVTELYRVNTGATLRMQAQVRPGDRVSVLGLVSERDGQLGFYDEVFIAKGTYEEWHAHLERETQVSFRREDW